MSDPMELELHTDVSYLMWMLGIELRSSDLPQVTSACNY